MSKLIKKIRQRYRYSLILLKALVRADFKLRYQNSVLGYVWSILRPLLLFFVLYLVFAVGLRIGKGIPYWTIALLLGIVLWEFFNEVTKQSLRSIVGKGSLIRKINFPRYIIILSNSLSSFINLLLGLVVILVFIFISHAPITWSYLLIPLFIVEMYIFALGVAFFLATLYVKVRDINFIWEVVLRAGFFATGIMYPMSRIFDANVTVGKILLLNPAAQIIEDARHGLLYGIMPSSAQMFGVTWLAIVPFIIVVVFFCLGTWYFRRRSAYFAEEV